MTWQAWRDGRRGRALAAALLLVTFWVIWLAAVGPARSWMQHRAEQLNQRRTLLWHMRRMTSELPALRQAALTTADQDRHAGFLAGATDALAAAMLQDALSRMALSSGIVLTNVETVSLASSGPWRRTGVRITFNAPWPALLEFLRNIEATALRTFIDDVHLSGDAMGVSPLHASMLIYGLRSGEASSERQGALRER